MPITRDFKETIQKRAENDPEFREGMLRESLECMLEGDLKAGKSLLRDYINATLGFEKLARLLDKEDKSLMRMLSPKGNPTAANLFSIIQVLQKNEGVSYELRVVN